jgi:hypothetical protein
LAPPAPSGTKAHTITPKVPPGTAEWRVLLARVGGELGALSGGNRSNRMSLLLDRDWAVLSEADDWGEVTAAWLITIVCLVCLWLT